MPDYDTIATTEPAKLPTQPKRIGPFLAWHAVSIGVVFVLALALSFPIGQQIYRHLKLEKLEQADQKVFDEGVAYVYEHGVTDAAIRERAIDAASTIEPKRGAEVLRALAFAYGQAQQPAPEELVDAAGPVIRALPTGQSAGLYYALYQLDGVDREILADHLLFAAAAESDQAFLDTTELLKSQLLWSKQTVKREHWMHWLSLVVNSNAELTQINVARQIGALPDAVDDPRVRQALQTLSASRFPAVRSQVLQSVAGYAAIAKDPTGYEQILFTLGGDTDPKIARHAWLCVGHLNPLSGYPAQWKKADPMVAEAMLWATAKTNPQRPEPIWQAYDAGPTRKLSLQALSLFSDPASLARFNEAFEQPEPERVQLDIEQLIRYLSTTADVPSAVFDQACVALLNEPEQLPALIDRLVRTNQDNPRMLGVMLASLSGHRPTLIDGDFLPLLDRFPDLTTEQLHAMTDAELADVRLKRVDALTALLQAAEEAPASAGRQDEARMLRLALWTRGDYDDAFTRRAEAMLFDEQLPTTTILMCLLHERRPIALDYLLGNAMSPPPDLHRLLVGYRWWYVLEYFTSTSDLTLWLWGDPEAQAFQIQAMRQWYAVNRWRIEQGWWPEPAGD